RLVVAARDDRARRGRALGVLERAEVAEDRRAPELVVERGPAERPVDHDLEGARDPARRADPALGRRLPWLERAGDAEVGHREPDEAGLRLRAAAGGALVADLAARSRRRARERRDRRRVIVRLDLREDVRRLAVAAVHAVAVGEEPLGDHALDHRGVVVVRRQHAAGRRLRRALDELEQRAILWLTVDRPGGVEDLVPAVL